ncbi:hypothetical protein C7T35_26495 [Variovorax sp. WS11]|nr:hypothetical protein C7T35_26495 [Variovorax sp. WS11]
MQSLLGQVTGVKIVGDRIVVLSRLGEKGLDHVAEAIVILVDADRLVAACTVFRMCEPSVRLKLLKLCGSERVNRWRSSDDPQVCKPLDRALDAAAHEALGSKKYGEVRGLWPWCSPATRKGVATLLPRLTVQMLSKLSGDELVEAVRLTLECGRELGTAKCLVEIPLLLSVVDELKTTNPLNTNLPRAATMMSMICLAVDELSPGADEGELKEFAAKLKGMARLPELTRDLVNGCPDIVRDEVLRVAVVQAAAKESPGVCVTHLLGLAALSDQLGESDADRLRFHIMSAVSRLLVRWDESVYQAHKGALLVVLATQDRIPRGRFLSSVVGKTGNTVEKPADTLIQFADDFRRAVDTDDLRTAALLIRDWPYPEFGNPARERLSEAVIDKLAVAGYKAELRPFSFMVLAEMSTDVEQEEQRSVALQMAVVLAATGDPECSQFAGTILSIVFPMPEDPQWAIQWIVGEPKPDIVGAIPTLMINALPLLCTAELSPELDVVLKMDEGQKLVAEAAMDGFLNGKWNNANKALLFNALAHRVDLGPALPAIKTTVRLEDGGKARIEQVLDGRPLTALKELEGWRMFFNLSAGQVQHVHPWARGWRFLWIMLATKTAFLKEPMFMMGAIAIDAAAADGLRGGADELLHRLKFPWAQEALDAMLQIQVDDKPLLSDDDLQNVLRAMLSDEQLGRDMFIWMGQVDDPIRKVELHAEAAQALISLAGDSSPCRFYPKRRADHAVGEMVRMFEFRLRFLNIGKDVETKMNKDAKTKAGKKAWREISSMFPPSRREMEPGLGQD